MSHLVLPENTITRLTDVGLSYLNPENAESPMGKEFVASQAVARMILNVAQEQVKSKQEKDKVAMYSTKRNSVRFPKRPRK